MNKPITEEDFAETLAGIGAKFPNNYGHATFELAKRMAIDFGVWIKNNFDRVSTIPDNVTNMEDLLDLEGEIGWVRLEGTKWEHKLYDTYGLFELYQQQKQ